MKHIILLICISCSCLISLGQDKELENSLVKQAQDYFNQDSYEDCIEELDYYYQLEAKEGNTNLQKNAEIEILYILSWLNIDNVLEADRHLQFYFAVAKEDHKDYSKMQKAQKSIADDVKAIKTQIQDWVNNASRNGKPYNWEAHSNVLAIGLSPEYKWCGYVNKQGEVVIPLKYRFAADFKNGVAYVQNRLTNKDLLIDIQQKTISKISREYKVVYPFQEGFAVVKTSFTDYETKRPLYGIINDKGDDIHKTQYGTGYSENQVFSDRSKIPLLKNGRFGVIDTQGNSLLDDTYTMYSSYHSDKILVIGEDHRINRATNMGAKMLGQELKPAGIGVFDETGKEIISINENYELIQPFFFGYSIIAPPDGGLGVVNSNFEEVIPYGNKMISRSSNPDEFIIFEGTDITSKCNVINVKTGQTLPKPVKTTHFKKIDREKVPISQFPYLSEELLPLFNKKGRIVFYNHELKQVLPDSYNFAKYFSEDLAVVTNKENKAGFINTSGELVIPYQYNTALSFSNELANVSTGDFTNQKWGYINKKGEEVIPSIYDYSEPFFDSTKIFEGYYNHNRDILSSIIPFDNEFIGHDITFNPNEVFFNLLKGKKIALVKLKDKMQFIDQKGNVLVERPWDELDIRKEE